MNLTFENYHCHSYYSNSLTQPDSTVSIMDYAKAYAQRGMQVLCLSEHGNRSNVWETAAAAEAFHLKPLAAAECYFVPERDPSLKDDRNFHLVLVAKDMEGFYQMNEALSEANLTGYYRRARVDFDILSRLDYRHFLCTTACVGGVLKDPNGWQYCLRLRDLFKDNFYLEIQHHPQAIQVEHNRKILQLYQQEGIPLLYGTDSHYIYPEEAGLRKELLLSAGIQNDYEDEFQLHLPTPQEAYDLLLQQQVFSPAQIQEAMHNTLQLRDFEGLHFTTEKKIPNIHPELSQAKRNHLYKKMVCDGYIDKAGRPSPEEAAALHQEMDAIADTGTADYFIVMKKIVDRGLALGGMLTTTGRGSGVSFATNYALGFTSINRLRCPVKLYPERFISKDRLASGSLPDLDLNMANVEAFQTAAKECLGEYGALPMVAFGTCKTLSAFKLLARARNLDFQTANTISEQLKAWELDVKHAKENNQDDPDYDVTEDIQLSDYVSEEYLPLLQDSAKYKGIVVTMSPHPCAHLLLDQDIRRAIGVIQVKAKSGNKPPVFAAYIDGVTADANGYLKADFLRVDVVGTISNAFAKAGLPVLTVDELLEKTRDDEEVWQLYKDGYTIGLNQCEQFKTAQRCKQYSPKNIVELTTFVAAVRPGFKSMVETFVSRTRFNYKIPSLDVLLQCKEIPDSFLAFDEQILSILQQGGISPSESYACIKAIKKKKQAKVQSYRQQFEAGFGAHLQRTEHASKEEAEHIVNQIWTIINDAASYLFCRAHAFSMACDSLYAAYLKAHYPYAFYATMLQLYSDKGNKKKVAQIILEMKRCKGIRLVTAKWGQDNRTWYCDEANHTISQCLTAVKFVPSKSAEDIFQLVDLENLTFPQVLRKLQMETCLNSRALQILIRIGYFETFGSNGKLLRVYREFLEGDNRITKTISQKGFAKRFPAIEQLMTDLPEEALSMAEQLATEQEVLGMCISTWPDCPPSLYFVQEVEAKYGVKVQLYNPRKGTSGQLRVSKANYDKIFLSPGKLIEVCDWQQRPRCRYEEGKRVPIPGQTELWLTAYVPHA